MTKEVVKYTISYTIHFNENLQLEPVMVWEKAFIEIEKALKTEQFVNIWGMIHNKFNILYIKPYQIDEDCFSLLRVLDKETREKVKKEIKFYKNKLSKWVVENMIEKYKNQ